MEDEVDLSKVAFLQPFFQTHRGIEIPSDRTNDPFSVAHEIIKESSSLRAVIFLPGTQFDRFGTRHGRGGGWYDRFLSQIPTDWIRVGVTDISQVSNKRLVRQSWDEPVDWILFSEGVYKIQEKFL